MFGVVGTCSHPLFFQASCVALPATDGGYVTLTRDGTPAIMLSFVQGKAADSVVESGVDALHVLDGVGQNLAALHSVQVAQDTAAGHLRDYTEGGCCLLGYHASREYLSKVQGSEFTKDHPYTAFYESKLEVLQACVTIAGLPTGILHGDPFLDNMLVEPTTGDFIGFVDFEDACVGPLVFDVAVAAIGCCYRAEDNALDLDRVKALLKGYCSKRMLSPVEKGCFADFMMVALLCNCSWRFMNFHIDHRELEECRDTYMELQERIVALGAPGLAAGIEAAVSAACE